MSKANDLTGKRFGQLEVVERAANDKKGNTMWKCRCDCGREIVTHSYTLAGGRATSCGCRRATSLAAFNRAQKKTHGETRTRLYNIWRSMRARCGNPNHRHYRHYGGRGITVCEEWSRSYEAFRDWALANGYRDDLTIDRKDNDGNYEPGNCRWATMSEQNANRRHYKHKSRRTKR